MNNFTVLMLKKRFKIFVIITISIFIVVINLPFSYSQEISTPQKITVYSVILGGDPLFEIKARIGAFSPEERAQATSKRLEDFAEDTSLPVESLKLEDKEDETSVLGDNRAILVLVDADAKIAQKSRQELTTEYFNKIKDAVQKYRESRSFKNILLSIFYAFLATLFLIIIFKILSQLLLKTLQKLESLRDTQIPTLKFQNIELLPATKITDIIVQILKFLRTILFLGVFYLYVLIVLSIFPWTKRLGTSLSSNLLKYVGSIFQNLFSYLPNLLIIASIIIFTYYILKFVHFIFAEIAKETFAVPGFYSEWARPTNKLVTFLIIALAAIIIFPYFPGSSSPAFQGVSVFLGLLLSLGSSSAVSNVVAGIILIYTRAFEVGDRVKIGDAIGDIVEKTLLVTRILTIKNVVITIPNASVLNSQIINFSAALQDPRTPPLILHTTITLGYDLPWRTVHQALINAAHATEHILDQPAPFVLQTSLDDFYVSYEINAYTSNPKIMARIYSELHQNIQDKCNEVGIEILSPHYRAVRDGNQNTIPENYLPSDYIAPQFRISTFNESNPNLKSDNQESSEN